MRRSAGAVMFRMVRAKPPHGWNAVAWELGIVTAGVLIALAAQQWAENRAVEQRTRLAKDAIRQELQEHYGYAYEFRVVAPCILAQIDMLEERVMASGPRLMPSPRIRGYVNTNTVVMGPSKDYNSYAYDEAQGNGLVAGMGAETRHLLSQHYGQMRSMREVTRGNDIAYQQLLVMTQPIALDPSVRYSLLEKLSGLRGSVELMDLIAGQLLDYIGRLNMVPTPQYARQVVTSYSTYKYCSRQKLPMRSFKDALVPLPN